MENILSVKKLTKSYQTAPFSKPKKVLHNISFDVPNGCMTGFLGVNGSGKSTTIKSLLEIIYPDSGEILFFGEKLSPKIKKRISYLPEKPQLYDHLSGEEFLNFTISLSGLFSKKEIQRRVDLYLEKVELSHARKYKLREYSKGMYQRIGLAQAISRNAEFIILDEPMSDLDPSGRMIVKNILKEIQQKSEAAVFFSSHLLQDIEDLCKNIVILDKGHTKYSGTTYDFMNKIKPSFEVQILENNELKSFVVAQDQLQQKIQELVGLKKQIVSVQNQSNLEDAFQKFIGDNS